MNTSTFGAFTTARLGMYASMKGLSVTGNNIANINTPGYTRQVLDQVSLNLSGMDRYHSINDAKVGQGVLCTGVSQLRDPYLDIRFRNEQAYVGAMTAKLNGLNSISSVLDEVGKGDGWGVIENQMNDLVEMLYRLSESSGQEDRDTLVRSSASSLTALFKSYAEDLEELRKNQITAFQEDLTHVNTILTRIGELSDSIRKSEIHGDGALEARDERNLLIDELAQYVKIDVTYTSEDIGAGRTVQRLNITVDGHPDYKLIDGNYASQFELKPNDPNFNLKLSDLKNNYGSVKPGSGRDIGDNDLYGAIQSSREMLTECGEFTTEDPNDPNADPDASTKRGIPYYQKSLDALARKFATVMNEANQSYVTDADGNFLDKNKKILESPAGTPLNKSNLSAFTPAQKQHLAANGWRLEGILFSNSTTGNDTTDITAANISISHDWSTRKSKINTTAIIDATGAFGSTAADNVDHIISQFSTKYQYTPQEIEQNAFSQSPFFEGSFQEMLANISSTLANDTKTTTTLLNNHTTLSLERDTSRDSISGVDLNDEAANLMQYQKSYAAACRLMTTIDEALDKLINGMGIVGR